MDYPKWIYSSEGARLVQSPEDFPGGWVESPADVGTGSSKEEDPADDIEALKAEAESLGIKVDGRWKAARIAEEIAKARQ